MTDNQKGKTTNVSDSLANRSLVVSTLLVSISPFFLPARISFGIQRERPPVEAEIANPYLCGCNYRGAKHRQSWPFN